MPKPRHFKNVSPFIQSLEAMVLMSASSTDESVASDWNPITAFHRDGQTFLTWLENENVADEQYHVYRHFEPITAQNLNEAEKLTDRWGPLDDETSRHKMAGPGVPQNFVINDEGSALNDDIGLFVYTTQDDDFTRAYYAVTEVINGQEQFSTVDQRSLSFDIQESVEDTSPVLVRSRNNGLSQVFTHFMDYSDWNPTFQGYAYNYAIALPTDYDPGRSYPLKLELHAYYESHYLPDSSEGNWPAIQLFVDDPGETRGTLHTWWYGFAADHNYNTDGDVPTSGVIENFTEQRVLKAIDEVSDRFSVDDQRIHARGNSMGASGALAFGVRYGQIFSGIYASQPMTDYETSPVFQSEFIQLWGRPEDNLTIRNEGPGAEIIAKYGDGGSQPTGVWDWQDHGDQLMRRRGEEVAFLMFGHGKDDRTIDWQTQGQPFIAKVNQSGVAYTGQAIGGLDHTWIGFTSAPHSLVSSGSEDLGDWVFRSDEAYLAVANASGSGNVFPNSSDLDEYNLNVDWGTTANSFGLPTVDEPGRFEISVRSLTDYQTADVTPRRMNQFRPAFGQPIQFTNVDQNTGSVLQSGTLFLDEDGLIQLNGVTLASGAGSRLILTTDSSSTVSPPPPAPEPEPTPPQLQEPPVTDPIVNPVPVEPEAPAPPSGPQRSGFGADDILPPAQPSQDPASEPLPDPDSSATPSSPQYQSGTASDDWLTGSSETDVIEAGDGNDEIHVPLGENFVDGGNGLDTVTVYEGFQSDFTITRLSEDTVLLTGPGIDGNTVRNTLSRIEWIHFNDGQVEVASINEWEPTQVEPPAFETVAGTNEDDWVSINADQGTVTANAGNDELHAPIGEHVIDGGAGVDRFVVYEGVRSDFEVIRYQDGRIIVSGPGVDGRPVRNTLLNVEEIAFNDVIIPTATLPVTG